MYNFSDRECYYCILTMQHDMSGTHYAINKLIIVQCTAGSSLGPLILCQIIEICILVKMRVKKQGTGGAVI
jgi:hypothetical protein